MHDSTKPRSINQRAKKPTKPAIDNEPAGKKGFWASFSLCSPSSHRKVSRVDSIKPPQGDTTKKESNGHVIKEQKEIEFEPYVKVVNIPEGDDNDTDFPNVDRIRRISESMPNISNTSLDDETNPTQPSAGNHGAETAIGDWNYKLIELDTNQALVAVNEKVVKLLSFAEEIRAELKERVLTNSQLDATDFVDAISLLYNVNDGLEKLLSHRDKMNNLAELRPPKPARTNSQLLLEVDRSQAVTNSSPVVSLNNQNEQFIPPTTTPLNNSIDTMPSKQRSSPHVVQPVKFRTISNNRSADVKQNSPLQSLTLNQASPKSPNRSISENQSNNNANAQFNRPTSLSMTMPRDSSDNGWSRRRFSGDRWKEMDDQINNNLGVMSTHLGVLSALRQAFDEQFLQKDDTSNS